MKIKARNSQAAYRLTELCIALTWLTEYEAMSDELRHRLEATHADLESIHQLLTGRVSSNTPIPGDLMIREFPA